MKGAAYQELHEERKAMDVLLKLHVQILRIKDALQRCMDALSVFFQDPLRSAVIYRQISRLETRLERETGLVDALDKHHHGRAFVLKYEHLAVRWIP